jgi:hypothetical protein
MGTPARIIVHCADAKWRNVYLHFDGHLFRAGHTLFTNYNSQAAAEALVAHGNMRALYPTLVDCKFWHRDMGRELEILERDTLRAAFLDCPWTVCRTYVWSVGQWWVGGDQPLTLDLIRADYKEESGNAWPESVVVEAAADLVTEEMAK